MKEIQSRLIRVFLLAATTGLLIISFSLPQIPSSLTIPVQAQTREPGFTFNEFLIETPHFTLPFHLVNGLPLINGRVNNIPGKFLFDTGTHFAFFLNKPSPAAFYRYLAPGSWGRESTGAGVSIFEELCNRLELSRSNHNVTQTIARSL